MREIQAQQDELSRKLTEKISDDLSKFQKTMEDANISLRKSKKNRNMQT